MKNSSNLILGIVILAVGFILLGNSLNLWDDINIFFKGWWALFIIIPAFNSLIRRKNISLSLAAGIGLAVILILWLNEILPENTLAIVAAAALVLVGIDILAKTIYVNKSILKNEGASMDVLKSFSFFGGNDIKYPSKKIAGAELTNIFSGSDLDLSNAIIDQDIMINIYNLFGAVDIVLPEGVNVHVNTVKAFGGVSNLIEAKENAKNAPTIYITGICLFGGIDLFDKNGIE